MVINQKEKDVVARMLAIPHAKCMLSHEEIFEDTLDNAVDVALEAISVGIQNDAITCLAGLDLKTANYFYLRDCVRRFTESINISPVHGFDALGLYVLCKIELYKANVIDAGKCIQLLADLGRDPKWSASHLLDEVVRLYYLTWCDDTNAAKEAWGLFDMQIDKIQNSINVVILSEGDDPRFKIACIPREEK